MNAGPTGERVYDALKRRLMNRAFRPGERLDPAVLADALAASVTPVRDGLNQLAGEGLVETRSAGGFHVPGLDAPALQDLYDWSADVIALAVRTWPVGSVDLAGLPEGRDERPVADRIADTFLAVARCSTNSEHPREIGQLNARLHAVRTVEPRVLDHLDDEAGAVRSAAATGARPKLRQLLTSYHRRRRRAAADIVRALYRI